MKDKTLLAILWISSIISLFITIGAYFLKFYNSSFSNDPANWGQFGDYIGGILNPIISLLNLIILTYLSIKLVKLDDDRNKWTLQELARPYGDMIFSNFDSKIKIQLHNCGLGPMIISKMIIRDSQNETFNNFRELLTPFKKNIKLEYEFLDFSNNHFALVKDKAETLMRIEGNKDDTEFLNYLKEIKIILSNCTLEISYEDMYKRKIDTLNEKIRFTEINK